MNAAQTKRFATVSGAILFLLSVLGFAGGAATGFFKAGGAIQSVESRVVQHEQRLGIVEVTLGVKADKSDVEASERRITKNIDDAVSVLRADIREIRARR